MIKSIKINPADNVAVALVPLGKGERHNDVVLLSDIPAGHKFALTAISTNENIVKYGFPIGHATAEIKTGEWVHSHNLATSLSSNLAYEYHPADRPCINNDDASCREFMGYVRSNGNVGIRNELWVIPTVGCVNGQANTIVARIKAECDLDGIDDVRALTHNYGCSQLGDDHTNTRSALAALVRHPNAGGVLVLGLGCENNQLSTLRESIGSYDPARVKFLVAQDVEDEIAEGVELCKNILSAMKCDKREPVPVSKLRIGLKCGGSDGLSGITANPLVGMFSDWLISCGGTTVLTEVPEMFGAETILMDRAESKEVFDATVGLINGFKHYFECYGQPIFENPSPGNKAGGITTLEEKSLGCVQKGGKAKVTDVLAYAEPLRKHGLNLLWAPGNDLVASTALALSGCQMVLFTTGRGTPFGTIVPTLKIATNPNLAVRKPHWIDFNAAILLTTPPTSALAMLIDKVIDVTNGTLLHHERLGAKEIAIFKSGVTL